MLYSSATDHTCRCWNVVRWTTQGFTTARPQHKLRANSEETVEEALKLWEELFQNSEANEFSSSRTKNSSEGIIMPKELRVYQDDDAVTSVAICPERKLLFTASPTQAVRAWSLVTGERVGEYVGHTDWVYGVIVHGGVLYSCSRDQTIRSWNIETFECTQVFETETSNLNTKKFFVAGGVLFVTCDDLALRLYNTRTGKVIRVLEGHTRPIRCMVLFKSQRELFTASGDGTIRRWNFKKGLELAVYKSHTAGVTSLTIDEQRRLLYSAGQDGVVCVWDLSEAGDKANKLSETDGELMQYKRRIDNIIQRSSALDDDDKLIKVKEEVLRLIQDDSDSFDAVQATEEASSHLPTVPTSPRAHSAHAQTPLSPRLASMASACAAVPTDGQAKTQAKPANKLLKSGLFKLARAESWRTKPAKGRDEVSQKQHDVEAGSKQSRKPYTANAITTSPCADDDNEQSKRDKKVRAKGDGGGDRVVLVEPMELDKRRRKGDLKRSDGDGDGKYGSAEDEKGVGRTTKASGGMKMKDQLFRLGATFSFDRARRRKEATLPPPDVKRSVSDGNMPAVLTTAHKDRIQWLPEDKYSSNQSLIIKPATSQIQPPKDDDVVVAGVATSGEEPVSSGERRALEKEPSREFDILGWMEEQIAIQDESEERRQERAKSNSEERQYQLQTEPMGAAAATDDRQPRGSEGGAQENPSVEAVEEEIGHIALVAMKPFADISYVDFGTVLYKVISLCMRMCDADRGAPEQEVPRPEALSDSTDEEAKRVRNDLLLSVKEFTRNGMALLQHLKRKALAEQPHHDLVDEHDDLDREDEGSDRKAFLTAARIMLAAVKQLAAWLHGADRLCIERAKSESELIGACSADDSATQTLFANLARQCIPATMHLLEEVRKPLDATVTPTIARDTIAQHLPAITELVGILKRAADGDDVQSAQWTAVANCKLLVLIQAARAVASVDGGSELDAPPRRQRLLVLECAVVVKASDALRSATSEEERDDAAAAKDLLRQRSGHLLAAVVQLLATIRQECPP